MARGFVNSAEVARRAGVSRSAVSRTFTPGASVSLDVRQRVLAAADELGYRVNRLAQSLISSRSNVVGVVGAHLETPFHALQLAQLSQALLRHGMQCMLLNAEDADTDIAPLIERLLEFRARAVVILSGAPPTAIVEECVRSGVRVILVNKPLSDVAADTIVSDGAAGAGLALDHLEAAGCRRLAVVGSAAGTPAILSRIEAFHARLEARGLPVIAWSEGPTGYGTGVLAARHLLPRHDIDGVFAVTDLLALGFMDCAREEFGRRIARDLSLIGFDDIPQAAWLAYRLTTVRQSVPHLTKAVMAALTREAEDSSAPLLQTVPVELILRSSVRPAHS